jgi:hypothetical protein
MRLHCPLCGIRLKVEEGDALLYEDRKVKRKQISGLLPFIDPNDNKHSLSSDDLYSFFHPRNVQGSFPLEATIPVSGIRRKQVSVRWTRHGGRRSRQGRPRTLEFGLQVPGSTIATNDGTVAHAMNRPRLPGDRQCLPVPRNHGLVRLTPCKAS